MMVYIMGFLAVVAVLVVFYPVIWKKIKVKVDVAANKVNDLLDNPIEEAVYDIKVSEAEIKQARDKLTELIRDIKISEHELINKSDEVDKDRRLAESYAAKKDEDNARKFLKKAKLAEAATATLTDKINRMKKVCESMRANIDNHESRIENAKSKTSELTARIENAQLESKYTSYAFSDSGLKSLDNLEKKVERLEAETEAKAEVYGSTDTALVDDDVEAELAKLMGR